MFILRYELHFLLSKVHIAASLHLGPCRLFMVSCMLVIDRA